jgi:dolichyl-diphosphooligosaccharide--protein glycosyltransferase
MGGKFPAIATLSGNSPDKFYGIYYQLNNNTLEPVLLFYPEYYRSLVVRLYNFDGKNVISPGPAVISYEEKATPDGQYYRQITSVQSFDTYAEAQNYVTSQKSGNYRIVSGNPYASPVPLPAVEHYKLIYSSKNSVTETGIGTVPEVKIFEYTK